MTAAKGKNLNPLVIDVTSNLLSYAPFNIVCHALRMRAKERRRGIHCRERESYREFVNTPVEAARYGRYERKYRNKKLLLFPSIPKKFVGCLASQDAKPVEEKRGDE